ncbi:(S)-ureidoglycine aminohydrolase [Conexibacter woesei]|uniref:Cupin 2 conserved barrel domain protein n=1 Tax=Conexibacter woesei (strain DSM 14684 / CCUG 47730 / CIP 108061 / JCM 11494 / NBRC 100937 / ID131577) TaxID=469383 RepID=D3F1S1_CONWI|nr:(S)-ureidoglycine aminohydrolase [Conexibacter woesei]ADB54102.1 Cupin 2 conserved barrel domain protein [Conexibacter woesei DSM 14684]
MTGPLPRADYVSRSRGRLTSAYTLVTPDNRVEDALPFLHDVVVRPLVTPRLRPAAFGEYLLELAANGATSRPLAPEREHFAWCLDGRVAVGETVLEAGGWTYLPPGRGLELRAVDGPARALWVTRRYDAVEALEPPDPLTGHIDDTAWLPDTMDGGSYALLLPTETDQRYDMGMNLMRFEPGAYFPMVELHHHEHGLWMLEGQGLYHLDGDTHEVTAEDFVYMAPYCPQHYAALGWSRTTYLLYKDVNRDGFGAAGHGVRG